MKKAIDYKSLFAMNEEELARYIEDRLRMIYLNPSISSVTEEEPEDFLVNAIKNFDDKHLINQFKKIICAKTEAEWNKITTRKYDNMYLSRLLMFIEKFRYEDAHDIILKFASNAEYFMHRESQYAFDLYDQVLRTLCFIQKKPGYIERWWMCLKDDEYIDYRYTAFLGLRLCSYTQGIMSIAYLPKAGADKDDNIRLSIELSDFIRQYIEKGIDYSLKEIVRECMALKNLTYENKISIYLSLEMLPAIKEKYLTIIKPLKILPEVKQIEKNKESVNFLLKNHDIMKKFFHDMFEEPKEQAA